jgi:hypothetical protein
MHCGRDLIIARLSAFDPNRPFSRKIAIRMRYVSSIFFDEPSQMDRVATLLAQFPKPVILAASKWKWLGFSAVSAAFAGGGMADNINSRSTSIVDWFGVAFFGLGAVGCVYIAFLANAKMRLDEDGFGWHVGRLRERWRWTDVGDFAVVEYLPRAPGASLRKRVGFNDRRLTKTASQMLGERLSRAMIERDCFVPDASGSSSFGLPMEDLASLMSQWQERALAMRQGAGHKTVNG